MIYHLNYAEYIYPEKREALIFRMITRNRYNVPIPKSSLQKIDRTSSPAHVFSLRNAIDFIAPQNTQYLQLQMV